jgi:flagellar hook-length control protein FliK
MQAYLLLQHTTRSPNLPGSPAPSSDDRPSAGKSFERQLGAITERQHAQPRAPEPKNSQPASIRTDDTNQPSDVGSADGDVEVGPLSIESQENTTAPSNDEAPVMVGEETEGDGPVPSESTESSATAEAPVSEPVGIQASPQVQLTVAIVPSELADQADPAMPFEGAAADEGGDEADLQPLLGRNSPAKPILREFEAGHGGAPGEKGVINPEKQPSFVTAGDADGREPGTSEANKATPEAKPMAGKPELPPDRIATEQESTIPQASTRFSPAQGTTESHVFSSPQPAPPAVPGSATGLKAVPSAHPVPTPASLEQSFAAANHPSIVSAIHGKLLPNGGSMQLRLDPPQLGTVHVSVEMTEGAVVATLRAGSEEAARMLGHSLSNLKTMLEAQGVTVERLTVQHVRESTPGGSSQDARGDDPGRPAPDDQQQARQEQQRRELLRRMWEKLAIGADPLDLVA